MVQRRFPPAPTFPMLRPASEADLPRLAALSVLGFQDSEIFRYTRPRYVDFPQDAVASFANLYRAQICDPRAVVIVTEDWPLAEDHPADSLPPRVVVGVASWILPARSARLGQFAGSNMGPATAAPPDRDLCASRQQVLQAATRDGQRK